MNENAHRMTEPTSLVLFLTMATAWGVNYLFVVIGLNYATPLWLATLRAALGAAGVFVYLLLVQHRSVLSRRDRIDAMLLGIPNTAVFLGLWFVAASQVPAGETAIVIYTFPLWVALLSPWALAQPLTARHWASVSIGFLGVVLISQPWALGAGAVSPVALLELLGAAVSWAVGTVLFQRRFHGGLEMRESNLYQLAGGFLALLVATLAIDPTTLPQPSTSLLASVLWIGVFGTAYAYAAWYFLLARVHAATLSAYTFLVPLIALIAAAIFFGERFTFAEVAGMGLVLVSIYGIGTAKSPPPLSGRAEREPKQMEGTRSSARSEEAAV